MSPTSILWRTLSSMEAATNLRELLSLQYGSLLLAPSIALDILLGDHSSSSCFLRAAVHSTLTAKLSSMSKRRDCLSGFQRSDHRCMSSAAGTGTTRRSYN